VPKPFPRIVKADDSLRESTVGGKFGSEKRVFLQSGATRQYDY